MTKADEVRRVLETIRENRRTLRLIGADGGIYTRTQFSLLERAVELLAEAVLPPPGPGATCNICGRAATPGFGAMCRGCWAGPTPVPQEASGDPDAAVALGSKAGTACGRCGQPVDGRGLCPNATPPVVEENTYGGCPLCGITEACRCGP